MPPTALLAATFVALVVLSGLPILVWLVSPPRLPGRPQFHAPEEPIDSLCRLPATDRSLLVEVPFTASEVESLELHLRLWTRLWPCYRPARPGRRPDLMYVFNGDLSQPRHDALRRRLRKLFTSPVLTACFGSVSVASASLSEADDVYDKRRLHANWTVGPNRLFDFAVATAAAQGYAVMMQIELDMV
jgi:hypothetical protein